MYLQAILYKTTRDSLENNSTLKVVYKLGGFLSALSLAEYNKVTTKAKTIYSIKQLMFQTSLNLRYIGEGETFIPLVRIIGNPRIVEPRNEQNPTQHGEK